MTANAYQTPADLDAGQITETAKLITPDVPQWIGAPQATTEPEPANDTTSEAVMRPFKTRNRDGSFNWINFGRNQRVGTGLKYAGNRKSVFVELCRRANADGQCWPSQTTIAKDTELSVKQVGRELNGLEKDGWITREKRTTAGGTYKADLITINVDRGIVH